MANRMIRLFVSSTFQDFKEERDVLITKVFPSLEEFCQKNGFSFQVVDLRWGISKKDSINHQTLKLCLNEIKRCQNLSPKPNFLILQGDRYGWIPVPSTIPATDWDAITNYLSTQENASYKLNLLFQWFYKDENSLDCQYKLKENCSSETEEELKSLIFANIPENIGKGFYNISATELEIRTAGVFDDTNVQEHTIAVLRKPSDTIPYDSSQDFELYEDFLRANVLQNKLRNIPNKVFQSHIIEIDDNNTYIATIKDKLKEIIEERINEENQKEDDLTNEADFKELINNEYIDINGNYSKFIKFLSKNTGRVLLCNGTSGSGKSYLMKYYAQKNPRTCVGLFANAIDDGNQILSIFYQLASKLEKLFGSREHQLHTLVYENAIQEFSNYLFQFKSKIPIQIIIDGSDEISDWKSIKGSIFNMKLPENITIVVLNANSTVLKQEDLTADKPVFEISPIDRARSPEIIDALLVRHSRRISPAQMSRVLTLLPEKVTILYLHLIVSKLARETDLDNVINSISLLQTSSALIQDRLIYQKEYLEPRFFISILGYISIARDGISEQDLINLLLNDNALRELVEKEYPNWPLPENRDGLRFVYMLLWSRIHEELSDFFAESQNYGICHLRFRHGELYRQIDSMIDREVPGFKKALLKKYGNYFLEQPTFYLDQNRLRYNDRKLRECYVALSKLKDHQKLAKLLEDPFYIDGYIRYGWYNEIVNQLTELSKNGSAGSLHQIFMNALIRNRIQLISWPDSFLMISDVRKSVSSQYFTAIGYDRTLCEIPNNLRANYLNYHSSSLNGMRTYIPARYVNFAIRDDHIFAVKDNTMVRIFDYEKNIELGTGCSVKAGISSIFWKRDALYIRYDKELLQLLFDEDSNELYIVNSQKFGGSDLCWFSDEAPKYEALVKSGGVEDIDYVRYTDSNKLWYKSGFGQSQTIKTETLYYTPETTLFIVIRGAYALVLSNHSKIELLNFDKRVCLQTITCHKVHHVGFDQNMKNLFSVTETGQITIYPIVLDSPGKSYAVISDLTVFQRQGLLSRVKNGFVWINDIIFTPVHKNSLPYSIANGSPENTPENRRPAFCAFSVTNNWIAYYYYYDTNSYIRIFKLDTMEFCTEYQCDAIFLSDFDNPTNIHPFMASNDGKKLIVISRDTRYELSVLSMNTIVEGKPVRTISSDNSKDNVSGSKSICKTLNQNYYLQMKRWLPNKENQKIKNKVFQVIFNALLRGLSILCPIFNNTYILQRNNIPDLLLRNTDIRYYKGQYWLLDTQNNMVSVANSTGSWIAHYQFDLDVFSFSFENGIVYAIDEEGQTLQSITLQ